jgi:16S rRNA A1518/A1519 N6-dimethyltransferase RsmA/KsgA/DIM1 with predicted DNA glycosylase/AP lyase activity
VLRATVPRLTAVEIDFGLVMRLGLRMAGSNVRVVQADATDLPFPSGCFSAVSLFTMLHHLPSVASRTAW